MSSSPRIGMLISVPLPPHEGIGMYALNLARELQGIGYRPTLITRGRARPERSYELDGLPVVEVPFLRAYPAHVHLHGLFVSRYLRRHGGPFDLIHAHSPLVPPVRGPWPLLTTLHSRLEHDARSTRVDDLGSMLIRLQTPISVRLERQLLRRSDAVAVVDALIADEVRRDLGGSTPVVVRPNAVDLTRFCPSDVPRSSHLVLAVGRLAHGKGFEDLLIAWQRVLADQPAARLIIVGEGPIENRLRNLSVSLGIAASVRLAGGISLERRDELIGLYRSARLVVQPSHHEGLSTVLLEAMACGTPVVATAVGAHPELIDDGVNGRLVPPRAPEALATAIAGLLADPAGAAALGQRGHETVIAQYSWPSVASAYAQLYEQLMSGAGRAH